MKTYTPNSLVVLCSVMIGMASSQTVRADYKSTILADSPAGYYRLGESPFAYATAGNSGSGGAALDGQYQFGVGNGAGGALAGDPDTAAQFSGVARVDVPYSAALNPAGPFTIECWAMVTNGITTNVYRSPVTSRATGNRGYILYAGNNNRWQFWTGSGTGFVSLTGPAVVNDVWVHVVGTRDSLGTNRLYINGVLMASNSAPTFAANASAPLRVGAGASESTLGDFYFPGRVDEVAFYPTQLSDAQVAAHYDNGTNSARATPYSQIVTTDGAVGYWRLNDVAPASVLATNLGSVGAAADGNYRGSPVTLLPGRPGAMVGDPDLALGFSNTAARVETPYNAGLNPATFTVEAWAYLPPPYRDYQAIVSTRDLQSSTTRGFIIYANSNINTGFKWQFWTGRMVNSWNACVATNALVPDSWSHVVGTYDGTYQLLYVNGELVGALKPYLPYVPNTATGLRIGAGANETIRGDHFVNGVVDDVAVYGSALSQAAIAGHYAAAFLAPPAVITPPTIVLDPQNTTNQSGATVKMDSIALGGVPMSYQWFKDSNPVSGQTNFVLSLPNATTADSGNYQLGVTNAVGSALSSLAYLEVLAPGAPVITADLPTNLTVYVGGSPKIEVAVTGSLPFSYQWQSNGVVIAGATNASLILNNVQTAQSGSQYQVRVTNPYGFTDSAIAVLNVAVPNPAGSAAVLLAANPISFWRLGEDASITDSAFDYWGGNNGLYVSAVQHITPGALGLDDDGAVQLLGTGSYMVVSNSAPYDFVGTNAFTLMAWAKPDVLTGIQRLFSNRLLTVATAGFGFGFNAAIGLRFTAFGIVDVNMAAPTVAGQWQHIAVVRNGTTVTLYHNGVALGTSSVATIIPSGMPLQVGGNPDPLSEYFTGAVDEAAIFGSALSAAQIKAIYDSRNGALPNITQEPASQNIFVGGTARFTVGAAGTPPLSIQWKTNGVSAAGETNATFVITNVSTALNGLQCSITITNLAGATNSATATLTVTVPTGYAQSVVNARPIAYWRLNESTGATAFDSFGGRNGNIAGGAALGTAGPASPQFAGLDAGNTCYGFNGIDSAVDTGSFGLAGPLTVMAWINPNVIAGDRAIAGENASWSFKLFGSELRFTTPGILDHTTAGAGITAGVWQHVAATFEPGVAGGARFYLNGRLVNARDASALTPGNSFFWVGKNQFAGQYFDGGLDEVAVYDKALSADDIAEIHGMGAYGTVTPPFIVQQPAPQTVGVGGTASLSGIAAGSPVLRYQWSKDGAPLAGATNAGLTIANAPYAANGDYVLSVSNHVGTTNTPAVRLAVMPPAQFCNLTNDLVLHLKFEDNFSDASGRGHDGVSTSPPTFVPGRLNKAIRSVTDTTNGIFNHIQVYDTVNSVPLSDFQFSTNVNFSVSYWVKFTGAPSDLPFLCTAVNSYGNAGLTFAPGWQTGTWSYYLGAIAGTGTDLGTGYATQPVNDGQWHLLVHSFDRTGNAVTYLDGAQVDVRSMVGVGDLDSLSYLTIGQDPTTVYAESSTLEIDDLGIWRRALNPYEAQSIYTVAQAGKSFDTYGPVTLQLNQSGAVLEIIWQAGTLYHADAVTGPWLPVPGATAPYHTVTPGGAGKFYRVRL